ncbi:family 16 glycosylhydrolase [Tamlana sp. 2_MG-2023]|uniref:family 16 glycosylhydrolase n=1 Tax=unclassified Tamlana TaxID=2614803 RepID=UPI0026E3EB2B|nr:MULTISPECIES: family 16 glycosylhydrolase [unclassified Tamlana]MDO6761256.1 family 16 glycosylhydrolase [Tamlana sp. 2_MG-2023]MDO6791739.1 family 16 glycosylhydrolase [Tamlana sp. 1_MG-2023]
MNLLYVLSKKMLLLVLIFGLSDFVFAQYGPPKPPIGKRWVLNPEFSDEFNGTQLDTTKWLDHHPTWKGRAPGLFMPSQVRVANGYLQLKGEKMLKDTIVNNDVFNIKGAAVVSKNAALFGYYECRVKAAATTMSTTFWFSGGNATGPKGCDSYHQEWDIQECIGRTGDFDGAYFAKGMHSNAHYWYTECEGERHDYRAAQVRFEDSQIASKDFHVYGGWWRDEISASYYYDNQEPKHQRFYDKITDKPMDKPMYMRLVHETYPFPWISLPTDAELADDSKNTVYYDWVRAYELVDVSQPSQSKRESEIKLYDEAVFFETQQVELKSAKALKISLSYKANQDRTIILKVLNSEDKEVNKVKLTAYAGYGNLQYNLNLDKKLKKGNYKIVTNLVPLEDNENKALDINTLIVMLKN